MSDVESWITNWWSSTRESARCLKSIAVYEIGSAWQAEAPEQAKASGAHR